MFANPLWSLLILAGLIGMYIILRIRHGGPLLSAYSGVTEWIVKFRSWVAAMVAGLLLALPDVLVQIAPFDFSPWIGPDYAKAVTALFGIFMAVNTAMRAKPPGEVA